MLRGAVIVALGLVCCSAVSADGEWTEQQVQQSKQWKDARSPLILTKSGRLCMHKSTSCSPADMIAVVQCKIAYKIRYVKQLQ